MSHYTKSSFIGQSEDTDDVLEGDIVVDSTTRFEGALIPKTDCTYNLGQLSPALFWNNLFACAARIGDSNWTLGLYSGNPRITFASTDYVQYDRTANELQFYVNGGLVMKAVVGAVDVPSSSTLKVDTIVESTSANGVSVDGLAIKDSAINGNLSPLTDKNFALGSNTQRWTHIVTNRGTTNSQLIVVNDEDDLPDVGASQLVLIGNNVGNSAMNGASTVIVGSDSGTGLTTGDFNIVVGNNSYNAVTTGHCNTSVGHGNGQNSTGGENSLFGCSAGLSLVGASRNAIFGRSAGRLNVSGDNLSCFGYNSGYSVTGGGNSLFGAKTAASTTLTTGTNNTLIGFDSDTASSALVETSSLGYLAVPQANYDIQLGRRTDPSSGILYYRTQKVSDNAWIGGGSSIAKIDNSGHIARGANPIFETLFAQTANQTVANTAVETTLYGSGTGSLTLSANTLAVGSILRVHVCGFYSTPGGSSTPTFRIKLGGSTVASGAFTMPSNSTDIGFDLRGSIVVRTIGASGTVVACGSISSSASASVSGVNLVKTTTTTVDTTGSLAVDITVQWATASATRTITAQTGGLELKV